MGGEVGSDLRATIVEREEDELELGEVVGAGFVGVRRGGEGVEAGFGGIGGAEG